MTEPTHKKLSRRDALKALGAAIGTTALTTLPPKWSKPVLAVSELPQHGITSGCLGPQDQSQTFNYTGAVQSFSVPTGMCSIKVNAYGAVGGAGSGTLPLGAGQGSRVIATLAVTPGETLSVYVSGQGADGISGGTAGGWNGDGVGGGFYGGGGNSYDANSGGGGGSLYRPQRNRRITLSRSAQR